MFYSSKGGVNGVEHLERQMDTFLQDNENNIKVISISHSSCVDEYSLHLTSLIVYEILDEEGNPL
jgi:hypothetical protein